LLTKFSNELVVLRVPPKQAAKGISDTDKATVGKYASEHGVASAVRKFKKKHLKECTVRHWCNYYI